MSRFWQYFHDSLNWPAIFSPGPLAALVKGLALCLDDAREDILWLRRQANPATADEELVAKYGESRGILRTGFDTDESYRQRVVNAFVWHELGGKVRGVERILEENGFAGASVRSSHNAGLWAHFCVELDAAGLSLDQETLLFLFWVINEYKPGRSVLEKIQSRLRLPLERRIALAPRHRTETLSHLYFKAPQPVAMKKRMAMAFCGITSTRVNLARAVSE